MPLIFVASVAAVLFVCNWLARRLVRRQLQVRKGARSAVAFWTVVIAAISSLAVPLSWWLPNEAWMMMVLRASEATVVGHSTEQDTCETTRSDRRSATRYPCTKYTPIFSTVLDDGRRVSLPGNIRSTSPRQLGDRVSVVYEPGTNYLHERSLRSMALLVAGGLIDAILVYCLVLIVAYSFGRNTRGMVDIGISVVLKGLVPLLALGMFAMLSSVPYRVWYLGDMAAPLWATLLCLFFSLALLPLLLTYLRLAITRFSWR
jgi:hypothetical protein